MLPHEVPEELIEILNRKADKDHSREGTVLETLAEILTKYDELMIGADVPVIIEDGTLEGVIPVSVAQVLAYQRGTERRITRQMAIINRLLARITDMSEQLANVHWSEKLAAGEAESTWERHPDVAIDPDNEVRVALPNNLPTGEDRPSRRLTGT